VLVDFGLTRGLPDGQRLTGVAGTPGYLAPESIDAGSYSVATDRYAFGGVAYFVLTGSEPPRTHEPQAMRTSLSDVPELAEHPEVSDQVMAMLASDPDDRPAGVANWVGQLRRSSLAAGPDVLSPAAPRRNPTGPVDRKPRRVARRSVTRDAGDRAHDPSESKSHRWTLGRWGRASAVTIALVLLVVCSTLVAQELLGRTTVIYEITHGSMLTEGGDQKVVSSPDGRYWLMMQSGNLVVQERSTGSIVWQTCTKDGGFAVVVDDQLNVEKGSTSNPVSVWSSAPITGGAVEVTNQGVPVMISGGVSRQIPTTPCT